MLWLYDEFETDFTYNGIVLNNAYDSDIHWVLNTMYKLTFKYPTVDNDLYSFIEKGMIVKADEHDRTNLFRIKDIDISENDKCVTVTAYQKNYDFSKRLVNNFGRLRVNCMSVLDEWYSNFLSSEKDFSYYSDINAINSFVSHNDDTDNKLRTSFELLGGIADTYSADIDMHDKQISLLERLGRDTEEVLTTAKNISEFVNTSNSDEIVTRIYASSTFKVGDKYDKKDLREQHRQQLKALRESQKEYSQGRNAVKKAQQMKDEIAKRYAKELAKNNKKVKRSGKVIKSYSQIESEVNAKYQERERKSQQRKAESQAIVDRKKAEIESLKAQQKEELEALDEEITINLIVESPLINDYPFINEIAVSNNDLRTAEELEEWAMEYFTKQNIDKPKNSIKVTYEQLSEDINRGDTVILKYLKYGVDERIRVVETHYDPMLKKWKEFILGEKEGRLGSEVSNASSGAIAKANAYTDIITMDIERKVKERSENYDKLFKKNTDEINKKIEDGFEKAKASSEVIVAKIDEDLEKKLTPIRNQVSTTVENYNRQFQATNLEISKNRVEATKQIQALTDRVNNIQDISNNETVRELRGLVNGATSKVTELETSITREFTAVKKKNEDGLSAVKAEFKKGVDGLTTKVSSLEEYKNQDGNRTETLKQWVQRDTANQLTAARRSIESWVNEKGYATNSVVENKVRETANSFSREISNVREVIKDKVLSNDNLLLGTKEFISKHFAPAAPWQRALVWENETERYNDFVVKSTIYHFNGLWQDVAVEKGKTYEFGFFAKGSRYTNKIVFSPGWPSNDAKRPLAEYSIGNTEFTLTTNWKFHSFRFTVTSSGWSQCRVEKIQENNGIKLSVCGLYLREVKNNETSPLGWNPASEDEQLSINELNTWKQTATETLNTVSSGLNDTVKHSQLRIGADGIDFGSNKVFNGRNLASILSVSPESIKAITDRVIITPANENLAKIEYRNEVTFNQRDLYLNKISDSNKAGDEYYFSVEARQVSGSNGYKDLNAMVHVKYKDGTDDWLSTVLYPASGYGVRNCTATIKILDRNKEIEFIEPMLQQNTWSNYTTYSINKLTVVKKKSAELIVDGSIEGRQIKTQTLETGHHKAGSITSEIIAAKAVKVNNLLVDDAMIDEFVAHKAFISKLWAQDAFIKNLSTVKISATQLDTDWLSAYTGDIGGFRIGKNPNQPGDFWLTGSNNFNCGLNPGHNIGTRGAQIWAAWGYNWNQAGPNAWWVDGQGRMNCKGSATFYGGLHVYNARLDTHGQDIQGDANSAGAKTTVIWWSQINRVKSSVSDKRFKTNIKPTKVKAVDLLNKIEMVEFNWRKDNKFEKIGAIAQQVQSVEESLVVKDMDSKQSHSDYLRISYYDTIPYLIKAIQELSQQNNELKNKLEEITNG
ncbi:phage tail spike protein [uncultured Gemella sp.]|uniref:phage tail spike protein n=1 Tax=uncultured Gemella sp. TaxID=254352 RepID=UPI0025DEC0DA|nr:phage tail spike protein [uncultured Gemella sp.]